MTYNSHLSVRYISASCVYIMCCRHMLAMLWHCWLSLRKSIQSVKIEWLGVDAVICLERGEILGIWYWLMQVVLEEDVKWMCVLLYVLNADTLNSLARLNNIQGKLTWQQQHTFNCPLSGTTQVSRYQKGKTNLDFTEARDSEWQWHQLGHMQV